MPYAYDANQFVVSYAYNASIPFPTSWGGSDVFRGSAASLNATSRTVLLLETANTSGQILNPPESDIVSPAAWGIPNPGGYGVLGVVSKRGSNAGWFATGTLGGRVGTYPANPSENPVSMVSTSDNSGGYQYSYGRHLEGSNFLMADGHVKWLKGDAVSSGLAATLSTDAQNAADCSISGNCAEGTAYNGVGAHAVTFSPT